MNWIELCANFDQAPEDWSPIIDILGQMGCPNTLQTDRPPSITACLVHLEGSEQRAEEIKVAMLGVGASSVASRIVPDEDWAEAYKKFFKSRRVGKRFLIRPTWETGEESSRSQSNGANGKPETLEIVLDPGQAFGTGDHPTTRMCLALMEEVDVEGKRVADVGCGSGILSIGAVKLGAAEVAGVDIEPLSVEVAKANAEQNGAKSRFVAGDSITALGAGPWDVVVSNIISATLIAMTPELAVALPQGSWIVSGIIQANWLDVKKAAEGAGFTVEKALEEDGWVAAILKK